MRLRETIWQAIRSANWSRLGAALSSDSATYTAGLLALLASFFVGMLTYAWLSAMGSAYKFSDIPDIKDRRYVSLGSSSFIYYPQQGNRPAALNIYLRDAPIVGLVIKKSDDSVTIEWSYPYSLWAEIEKREGQSFESGSTPIVNSSYSLVKIPYVRNMNIIIPDGTLSPLLSNIVFYGAERASLDMDRKDLAGLISSIRELLIRDAGLEKAYGQVIDSALWAGEVQYLTFVVFIFFLILKFIGTINSRLNEICEYCLETLPYLGFFGTLLGMGEALQLLGNADVTNAMRKAISLGPIGSQMGLAVQTTMFAIIFYLAGGFTGRLIDLISEHLQEGADEPPGP